MLKQNTASDVAPIMSDGKWALRLIREMTTMSQIISKTHSKLFPSWPAKRCQIIKAMTVLPKTCPLGKL